jgi:uncharacterized phage infection (PIP) family protein YhgE
MKRIISAIVGFILIGVVIYLGIKSSDDNIYIMLFGVASALIAPMGLSALGYSVKREDETLQKLAKISQIDELIEQAETEEENIERLKKEKDVLLNYIKNETNRISKIERKKILIADAKRILDEYKEVVEELNSMSNMEIDLENVSKEIQELYNIYSENKNENRNNEHGFNLKILGLNYTIQGFLDFYSLPSEILVDQISRCAQRLYEVILKLVRGILNLFKQF